MAAVASAHRQTRGELGFRLEAPCDLLLAFASGLESVPALDAGMHVIFEQHQASRGKRSVEVRCNQGLEIVAGAQRSRIKG